MINWLMTKVAAGPRFRGKARVLKTLHNYSRSIPIRSIYGPLILTRPRDATNLYYLTGIDEDNYTDVVYQLMSLEKGQCLVDIGANAGLFSLVAGSLVGETGVVIGCEPSVSAFSDFVCNIGLNQLENVVAVNAAIGDATRSVRFSPGSRTHSGVGHIDKAGHARVWQYNFRDLLQLIEPLIDKRRVMVKIDVEGAEEVVVRSMGPFLCRPEVDRMIVEIDRNMLSRFGDTVESLYESVESAGLYATRGIGFSGHYNEVFVRQPIGSSSGVSARSTSEEL